MNNSTIDILFLDIDGVMRSDNQIVEDVIAKKFDKNKFDKDSCEVLREFIKDTGAKIVISSTWRYDMEDVYKAFEMNSLNIDWIVGKTPSIEKSKRGEEIEYWLNNNRYFPSYLGAKEVRNYVIFDDDTDMLYKQKDNFIHINNVTGLVKDDVLKAREILERG